MAKKVQLQTNGKEWQVIDGEQVLVDAEKQDIDPITSSSCVQLEGFRTLEEAVSDNKMLSQDLTYTKVMDKVGGDYHQNVLDGQYSKAILYGNTQVNLCEEDSSNALQIPTTFTSFNNGELQIKNKENQVVAPLIKGVTMVNLAQERSATFDTSNSYVVENVKGNTTYTVFFNFTVKNTNAGIIIQSYNGNTYLENSIHKTQLGDKVKFTFTTHSDANRFSICNPVAYGGETIQLDDIMAIEGDQTALDIPFFKGMKSVELVRPLTNLFDNNTPTNHSWTGVTNVDGTVTATSQASGAWTYARFNITFKPNTSYVVMWDSLTYTQTGNANQTIAICYGNDIIANIDNNFTNKRSIIFNTGDRNPSDINLRIHATTKNTETGTTTVTGLRVFEYDDYLRSVDLQSIGWFSGTKNVAVEPVKTCSKNLYPYGDINFTRTSTGWFDAKGYGNMYGDIAQKSKSRFLLKKGTYKLSSDYNNRTNLGYMSLVTDKEEIIGDTTFTLDKDTYLTLRLQPVEANVPTTLTNIQIERGETVTDYVAHDSTYYEPDGQNAIVLRSLPDGVCDTFNLQTGEYIQRIGEIVLNGSEDWALNKSLGDGSFNQFTVGGVQAKKIIQQKVVCDRLISKAEEAVNNVIWIYDGTTIVIQLSCTSVDELKTWLQQNPLTVQYEFKEPSITIIPRTIKRNNNGTVSTVDFKTYTNKESLTLPSNPSYLTINSMTSIKPVVEPITYIDFKTRLKTNTDYSVIMDKDSANKTINLGGTSKTYADKMLVRTPSIDLEQNLRISGSGSIQNIMVIEGDVLDKELPYFNGMCNVKMPIVKNISRNLLNESSMRVFYESNIVLRTYDVFPCKPNTRYCFVCVGGETSCNWHVCKKDAHYERPENESVGITQYLGYSREIVTPQDCHYMCIHTGSNPTTDREVYDIKTAIYEGSFAECVNYGYEDYKENSVYAVQGEIDLPKDMFEQGGFSANNGSGSTYETMKYDSTIRLRSKSLIRVKPNTTYYIKNNLPRVIFNLYQWNASVEFMQGTSKTNNASELLFTTTNDTHYIHFLFSKYGNENITVSEFDWNFFQLLELDSTVQLRSLPNGVKDELNLLTGEYIQRVGEVVIDGSQNVVSWWNTTSTIGVSISIPTMKNISNLVCDRLPVVYYSDINNSTYDTDGIASWDSGNVVRFRILKSKLTTEDVDGVVSYLQSNPITVQYELVEPIISYPRIVSNTQEREVGVKLPSGICDTYNPSTGITVKRVGKAILDGSEKWGVDPGYTPTANLIRFSVPIGDMKLQYNNGDLVCDKLPVVKSGVVPCIYNRWNNYIYIDFKASDIGVTFGTDNNDTMVTKMKNHMANLKPTLWYELKNPIVTTDIVLPNGVHDEYNPLTGLYTKRVGYVELDGSDDERLDSVINNHNKENTIVFFARQHTPLAKKYEDKGKGYPIYTNQFEYVDIDLGQIMSGGVSMNVEGAYMAFDGNVCFAISKEKLEPFGFTNDMNTIGQVIPIISKYLSQNPLKAWYELETPITYQLTPYFGLPMPYAYKDGYLIMDSAYDGQTLPPEITYQLTVNRTGQITQNNIKLKEHTARLSNLEYILIEATLDSIFSREMQNFELELMNIKLINLDE